MVVIMPRFSSTGLPHRPSFFSSEKFWQLRAPTCTMSACSQMTGMSSASIASVMTASPYASAALRIITSPGTPRPWNA